MLAAQPASSLIVFGFAEGVQVSLLFDFTQKKKPESLLRPSDFWSEWRDLQSCLQHSLQAVLLYVPRFSAFGEPKRDGLNRSSLAYMK